jgi:hypothetical protein
VKILDGNYLSATERRIAELRTIWDAPLPGRALVVWDQASRLMERVFLTEHGQASERSLLHEVLETVAAGDVWIADRNFCTRGFLLGLCSRKARFVIRQHGQLQGIPEGQPRRCGRTPRGEQVWEQAVAISDQSTARTIRRVTVQLLQPTRDGDRQLHIFTNLTAREASAAKVAELYARRWTIEVVFLELQTALCCEVHTLGYPRAALFAFCVALVLQNAISMLMGSLRAAHGRSTIDKQVSGVLLAQELRKTYDGMMVQIPPQYWRVCCTCSVPQFAKLLIQLAERLKINRYRKHPRGPKQAPAKKKRYRNGHHVSTAKILALRKRPP